MSHPPDVIRAISCVLLLRHNNEHFQIFSNFVCCRVFGLHLALFELSVLLTFYFSTKSLMSWKISVMIWSTDRSRSVRASWYVGFNIHEFITRIDYYSNRLLPKITILIYAIHFKKPFGLYDCYTRVDITRKGRSNIFDLIFLMTLILSKARQLYFVLVQLTWFSLRV